MAVRYDREFGVRYCDIHNENLVNGKKVCCEDSEPYWHNPDGTTNDIP